MATKLGLIVNPIAGMGGRVGLKGTDGEDTVQQARSLGAKPESPARAHRALQRLLGLIDDLAVITYPHPMGESEAREAGFSPKVIGSLSGEHTTAEDTSSAARSMQREEIDLLMFAGGDGTARDIYQAVGTGLPVVGIPTGVKMHSGVFATHPESAGRLAGMYLSGEIDQLREVEVMDIDEEAFRQGQVSAQLYGYLKVPYRDALVQGLKSGSSSDDAAEVEAIAAQVVDAMKTDHLYIIGPGTTTRGIMEMIGLDYSLLGVDVVRNQKLLATDVSESQLLELVSDHPATIVVTPIGGQGYIFGRGNQQISGEVISRVGTDHVLVIATRSKMLALERRPLLVDTGEREVDEKLQGYTKVIVGYKREMVYPVK